MKSFERTIIGLHFDPKSVIIHRRYKVTSQTDRIAVFPSLNTLMLVHIGSIVRTSLRNPEFASSHYRLPSRASNKDKVRLRARMTFERISGAFRPKSFDFSRNLTPLET